MSSKPLSREERAHLDRQLVEFQREKQLSDQALSENNSFAQRVLFSSRYPHLAKPFGEGDFVRVFKGLSEGEHGKLSGLKHHYFKTMSRLILSPGRSESDLGGFSMILHRKKGILQSTSLIDLRSPFTFTMMVPVELSGYQESEMSLASVCKVVRQKIIDCTQSLSKVCPPSIAAHYRRGAETDAAPWMTFFPQNKSYAGLYFREGQLHLVVSTHAGDVVGQELDALFAAGDVSASDFVASNLVLWVKRMSRRNCARVLYEIAGAIGVQVPFTKDFNAQVEPCCRAPRCAIPVFVTAHNTCSMSISKEPTFFHKCADGSQTVGGSVIVRSDLIQGLALLQPQWPGFNDAHGMFPVITGSLPKDKRRLFTPDEKRRYAKRIHFLRTSDSIDDGDESGDFDRSRYDRKMSEFRRESFDDTDYRHVSGIMGIPDSSLLKRYRPVFICSS